MKTIYREPTKTFFKPILVMGPAAAWTVDKKPEKTCLKVRKFLWHKRSFLAVIYPIAFLAKITGISGVSVIYRNGRFSAELSSKLTVRYSYGILVYSIVYQTVPIYLYYSHYHDQITLLYLVMRTLITTAIHYSMLMKRRSIQKILQREHDLGVRIPGFITALPVLTYISTFLASMVSTRLVHKETSALVGAVMDLRAPIFNVYGCFIYGCQASLLIGALKMVNSDLQKFASSPTKSKTLRPIIEQYMLLRQVCCDVNQSMAMPMLLTSLAVTCEIVYSLFLSCVATHFSIAAIATTWSLLYTIPGALTMLVCQHVETTFQKSKSIAMDIQLRDFPETVQNEARELQVQLRQLPMSFSALGWFSLNGDQMLTAFATVIRYTAILVQNIQWDLQELIPGKKSMETAE